MNGGFSNKLCGKRLILIKLTILGLYKADSQFGAISPIIDIASWVTEGQRMGPSWLIFYEARRAAHKLARLQIIKLG